MPLRRPKDSGGRVMQGTNALVRALFMVAVSALLLVRAVPASAQEQGLGGSLAEAARGAGDEDACHGS